MCARIGLETCEFSHPWKLVPLSIVVYQVLRLFGYRGNADKLKFMSQIGLPVNLFDEMRVVIKKKELKE